MTDSLDDDCEANFSELVTPPWHGENAIRIYGYQFRNSDNTGENDGSVNAPQKERGFNFVLNRADYELRRRSYHCFWWKTDCPSETEPMEDREILHSRGIMTITDLELGNLVPGEQAWIESMTFEVEVYLPAE